MKLLYGHDAAVARWVGDKLGVVMVPPYTCIGVLDRDGWLIGGMVYNGYQGANVDVTVYGPGAFGRDAILVGFHYAFVQLEVERITIHTRRSNALMRKLAPRLGFTFECVQRRFFGPTRADDAFVYGMLKHQCKWLQHGLQSVKKAA